MSRSKKFLFAAAALASLSVGAGAAAVSAIVPGPVQAASAASPATHEEYKSTIEAMKPPKRSRPLIAVLGDNRGTEAIDLLVPYGVLKRSGAAEVHVVGMTDAPLKLRPALTIDPHLTAKAFDRRFPDGADYVVVPAMFDHRAPEVIAWIKSQAARGATIVAICAGAEILAHAGLLQDRSVTTHWASVRNIMDAERDMRWVPHRRYVADRGIVSTTGVSAAVPVSIALVEAIAGPGKARTLAAELGVEDWGRSHNSNAWRLGGGLWTLAANSAARWKHEDVGVPVSNGVDDIALALTADSWSRTHRSKAITLASSAVVRTRYGLHLHADRNSRTGIERMLNAVDGERPAKALERSLAGISAAYGNKTARLVAVQLEHDGVY